MMEYLSLLSSALGLVAWILFLSVLSGLLLSSLIGAVMAVVRMFDGNLDKTAKPTKPDVAKWPRRIPTMEGDVLVYRSGKVRLIDERGNVWKAKLHDDLLGEGEV